MNESVLNLKLIVASSLVPIICDPLTFKTIEQEEEEGFFLLPQSY